MNGVDSVSEVHDAFKFFPVVFQAWLEGAVPPSLAALCFPRVRAQGPCAPG